MKSKQAIAEFEVAKLHSDRGDFVKAIEKFKHVSKVFIELKDYELFLDSQNALLRIYSEQERFEKITECKESLQDLVIQEGFELSSQIFYTLGVCAAYKKQVETAQDYFEKALKLALKTDNKKDICYAIYGMAVVYWMSGRRDDALKEIYNLQVFFQIMPLQDLKMASLLLNGHILRDMKKYDQALEIFWQAYDSLKESKKLYMYLSLLYAMGLTYLDSGDLNMGRMYLNLAKRSIDPSNHTALVNRINKRLEEVGDADASDYDLILNSSSHLLTERKKGRVDFKNQFILLDLLRLFMQNPGHVYSKELLVERVWKQSYDPSVHDNKVYVTIKRLRKLVEPDYDKPKYIFRSKNGYFLNKATRVMVD